MELRTWATHILSGDSLEEKLFFPKCLSDQFPGTPLFWKEPNRSYDLRFQKYSRKDKLPKLKDLAHKDSRAICMHRFFAHELLAVEIMAYAILAFPHAPKHFRKGLAYTLYEEQHHVRYYLHQMKRLGIHVEDYPLHKHFWSYTPYMQTAEDYVSIMALTFEMANLDYAPMYRDAFAKYEDMECAALMQRILEDEINHVSFGWNWLKKLKERTDTEWMAWQKVLSAHHLPYKRAMGKVFQEENRTKAGISQEWIHTFKQSILL